MAERRSARVAASTPPVDQQSDSRSDVSSLRQPIKLGNEGVVQIVHCLQSATKEVTDVLLFECTIIYECRVCKSLFRGLTNLLAHKRAYCLSHYSDPANPFVDDSPEDDTVIVHPEAPPEPVQSAEWDNYIDSDCESVGSSKSHVSQARPKSVVEQLQEGTFHGKSQPYSFYTRAVEKCENSLAARKSSVLNLTEIKGTKAAVLQQVGSRDSSLDRKEKTSASSTVNRKSGNAKNSKDASWAVMDSDSTSASKESFKENLNVKMAASDTLDTLYGDRGDDKMAVIEPCSPTGYINMSLRKGETTKPSADKPPKKASQKENSSGKHRKSGGNTFKLPSMSPQSHSHISILRKFKQCDPVKKTCLKCKKSFSAASTLLRHMKEMHLPRRIATKCPLCKSVMTRSYAVVKHLKDIHKKTDEEIEEMKELVYTKCRVTTGDNRSNNLLVGKIEELDLDIDLNFSPTPKSDPNVSPEPELEEKVTQASRNVTTKVTTKVKLPAKVSKTLFGKTGTKASTAESVALKLGGGFRCLRCGTIFGKPDILSKHQQKCTARRLSDVTSPSRQNSSNSSSSEVENMFEKFQKNMPASPKKTSEGGQKKVNTRTQNATPEPGSDKQPERQLSPKRTDPKKKSGNTGVTTKDGGKGSNEDVKKVDKAKGNSDSDSGVSGKSPANSKSNTDPLKPSPKTSQIKKKQNKEKSKSSDQRLSLDLRAATPQERFVEQETDGVEASGGRKHVLKSASEKNKSKSKSLGGETNADGSQKLTSLQVTEPNQEEEDMEKVNSLSKSGPEKQDKPAIASRGKKSLTVETKPTTSTGVKLQSSSGSGSQNHSRSRSTTMAVTVKPQEEEDKSEARAERLRARQRMSKGDGGDSAENGPAVVTMAMNTGATKRKRESDEATASSPSNTARPTEGDIGVRGEEAQDATYFDSVRSQAKDSPKSQNQKHEQRNLSTMSAIKTQKPNPSLVKIKESRNEASPEEKVSEIDICESPSIIVLEPDASMFEPVVEMDAFDADSIKESGDLRTPEPQDETRPESLNSDVNETSEIVQTDFLAPHVQIRTLGSSSETRNKLKDKIIVTVTEPRTRSLSPESEMDGTVQDYRKLREGSKLVKGISKEDHKRILSLVDADNLKCTKCGSHFRNVSNLHRHAVRHLGWRRYKCTICKGTFFNRSECRRHIRLIHERKMATSLNTEDYIVDLDPDKVKTQSITMPRVEIQLQRVSNQKLSPSSTTSPSKSDSGREDVSYNISTRKTARHFDTSPYLRDEDNFTDDSEMEEDAEKIISEDSSSLSIRSDGKSSAIGTRSRSSSESRSPLKKARFTAESKDRHLMGPSSGHVFTSFQGLSSSPISTNPGTKPSILTNVVAKPAFVIDNNASSAVTTAATMESAKRQTFPPYRPSNKGKRIKKKSISEAKDSKSKSVKVSMQQDKFDSKSSGGSLASDSIVLRSPHQLGQQDWLSAVKELPVSSAIPGDIQIKDQQVVTIMNADGTVLGKVPVSVQRTEADPNTGGKASGKDLQSDKAITRLIPIERHKMEEGSRSISSSHVQPSAIQHQDVTSVQLVPMETRESHDTLVQSDRSEAFYNLRTMTQQKRNGCGVSEDLETTETSRQAKDFDIYSSTQALLNKIQEVVPSDATLEDHEVAMATHMMASGESNFLVESDGKLVGMTTSGCVASSSVANESLAGHFPQPGASFAGDVFPDNGAGSIATSASGQLQYTAGDELLQMINRDHIDGKSA